MPKISLTRIKFHKLIFSSSGVSNFLAIWEELSFL